MAREDYKKKDVLYSIGNIPVYDVDRIHPDRQRSGMVFHKKYTPSSDIDADGDWIVNISDNDVAEFVNFNQIVIHNSSDVDLEVRFNGSPENASLVKANSSLIDSDHEFWNIVIHNNSSTTSCPSENVVVEISKINK